MHCLSAYESIPDTPNNFPIKIHTQTVFGPGWGRALWHEHIELLFILDGSGDILCNETTFPVEPGDLLFVNSTQIHAIHPNPSLSYHCILLYPAFFADIEFDRKALIQNHIKGDVYIKDLFSRTFREKEQKTIGSDMIIKGLCYALMGYLVQNFTTHQMKDQDASQHILKLKRAQMLFDYIAEHYSEPITSEQMARLCHVNESYFCRFFKKNFGRSPLTYLNEYRIEKASALLKKSQKSITEIAMETGYEDINYFSRTFKKLKSLSPTEYREQFKGKTSP